MEAECQMKRAIAERPNDPKLHERLGDIYEKAGKIDEAIDEMSRAVKLSRGAKRHKEKLVSGHKAIKRTTLSYLN